MSPRTVPCIHTMLPAYVRQLAGNSVLFYTWSSFVFVCRAGGVIDRFELQRHTSYACTHTLLSLFAIQQFD